MSLFLVRYKNKVFLWLYNQRKMLYLMTLLLKSKTFFRIRNYFSAQGQSFQQIKPEQVGEEDTRISK